MLHPERESREILESLRAQQHEFANRIHTGGRAVVWSGEKERAELYHEQLQGFGLTLAPLSSS